MRAFIQWLVNHATTVFISAFCVFLFGVLSFLTLPRESNPDITIPVVIITTPYVGVSPSDIDNLISTPMENELVSLKNLKKLSSTSSEGVSVVAVEFDANVVIEDALQRVRDRVSRVRPTLPSDVEESSIREISFSDIPVVLITIAGDVDEGVLGDLAEDLKEDIGRVSGVLDVKITGGTQREFRVEVYPERLSHYGLALYDITNSLREENVNIPGGNVETGTGNFLLRVPGELKTAEDIEGVPIKRRGGRPVYIRDVARVMAGDAERETFSRMAGRPAVTLSITKRAGANILEVAAGAKQAAADHSKTWPKAVSWRALGDESKNIARQVGDLQNNIITALLLVVGVVILFMGFRNSLFVAMVIPLAMLASMMVLQALGFTLNMVVLFSLVLALGMLVDNGIVIVENIYRHKEMGKTRDQASVDGTAEVALAVIASTATTNAAFFPLVFWGGIMGEFMGFLPKTVIIVLTASLVVSLVVLPVVMSRLMPDTAVTGEDLEEVMLRDADLNFVMSAYRQALRLSIRFRYATAFFGLVSLLATFVVYGLLNNGLEFFPQTEPERSIVGVRLAQGTDVSTTDRVVRRVEQILAGESNVDTWVAEVGVAAGGDALKGATARPNESRITVDFHPDRNTAEPGQTIRSESTFQTVDRLRKRLQEIPGAKITIEPAEMGPPVGNAINVEITGDDYDTVGAFAQELRRKFSLIEGATDLEDDYIVGRTELRLRVDRGAAKRVGVSTQTVGGTVRTAIAGEVATTIRDGEDEFDVVVQLAPEARQDLQQVLDLRVPGREDRSPKTFPVPLSSVASYELVGGAGAIRHIDQDLVVTIKGDVLDGFNENEVRKKVVKLLKSVEFPPGMAYQLTGADKEQQESMRFLMRAFALAIAGIMLVLVTQFDRRIKLPGPPRFSNIFVDSLLFVFEIMSVLAKPAIILATVVLSLIGVLWGLLLTNTPFGVIMTGIGVISLAGIVVNNAIVLLDYLQQLLDRGLSVQDALVEAGLTRFRPVVLTAITTTLGLVPMALGTSIDFFRLKLIIGSSSAQLWGPMAVAVIFGLSVATVLTLIMIPTLYSIYDDFRRFGESIFVAPEVPPAEPEGLGNAVALVLAFGLLVASPSAVAAPLTLGQVQSHASKNSLQLVISREQAHQQGLNVGRAWASLSPTARVSGGYILNNTEISFDSNAFVPPEFQAFAGEAEPMVIQQKDFWQADLTLSQRFFSGTALPGLRGMKRLRSAAFSELSFTESKLQQSIAQLYWATYLAQVQTEISETKLLIAKESFELAKRQRSAGLSDRRGEINAELEISRAERDLLVVQSNQAEVMARLLEISGVKGPIELIQPEDYTLDVGEHLLSSRGDLQALALQVDAFRFEKRGRAWAWAPTIDGQFVTNYTENTGFNDQNWTWRVALVANFSIWDGGFKLVDAKEASSRWRMAQAALQLKELEAQRELTTARQAVLASTKGAEASSREVALAKESVALTEASLHAGTATSLDLRQARLVLRMAELGSLQQKMQVQLAIIDEGVVLGVYAGHRP